MCLRAFVYTIIDLLAPSFGDESGASEEVNSANLLFSSLVSHHLVCCELQDSVEKRAACLDSPRPCNISIVSLNTDRYFTNYQLLNNLFCVEIV